MSADQYNYIIVEWLDKNNKYATTFLPTQDQGAGGSASYATLAAAFQACSDALVTGVQFVSTTRFSGSAGTGPYCTAYDRAVLLDRIAATNRSARQSIVGPKASIFQSDNITVDLANANIITLQTELVAVIGDQTGNAVGPIVRGNRQKASGS